MIWLMGHLELSEQCCQCVRLPKQPGAPSSGARAGSLRPWCSSSYFGNPGNYRTFPPPDPSTHTLELPRAAVLASSNYTRTTSPRRIVSVENKMPRQMKVLTGEYDRCSTKIDI